MKKVYILTWVRDENYGTSLQSFALFQIINRKFESIFIDYSAKQKSVVEQLRENPFKTIKIIITRRIKRLSGTLAFPYEIQSERHKKILILKTIL